MNARGRDRIRNNELDGTDWTSCWFHTDYFITECLFSIRLTSFQSRHFQLSIDITPMSVCWDFAELQFILVRFLKSSSRRQRRQRAHPVCFLFFSKPQSFVVFVSVHKKIDTSKFQLMYNTYLYDQNRRSILMSFALVLKKRVGIAGDTAVPLGLSRTCLTKWSMLKDNTSTRSKEIQEQMRNKIVDMFQSGKGYNILIIPKTFGQIFCELMRQKLNFLEVVCPITSGVKPTQHFIKIIIPTVKHGGGSVMVWGCFAASGPGRLAIIDGTMNSVLYQKILKENVRPSVCDLKLKRTWVMQQDNDPKHTSKSTSEWLKKN